MTSPKHFMDNRPTLTNENYVPEDEYAKQRKCRMQDAIDDYLQDERVAPRRIYEEMLSCVDDVIQYHQKCLDRANDLKHLMMGHRLLDDMQELSEKWHYDKIPSRY
tara:strand:+ start:1328 stop:1645 length:318 start_codon:yes stop_codon:yes gene_type:complete